MNCLTMVYDLFLEKYDGGNIFTYSIQNTIMY